MNKELLAIDVGGTSSRAYLMAKTGHCLGHGRNRGGNPASTNPEEAALAIVAAAEAALADAGPGPFDIGIALIAIAGPQVHIARRTLEAGFQRLGLKGPLVFAGDLLAMFASVTAATDGYCVVAGTGAGAVRIRGGMIERAVDASGWLLGDFGSGYWLGHQAARAVAADLDGRGEATALTSALLEALDIEWSDDRMPDGRPASLRLMTDTIYALRPIELARFAPLVIAQRSDQVAARLLVEAEQYLVTDFATAYDADLPGPIALGGGIIAHLNGLPKAIAAIVRAAGHVPDIQLVGDGSVGAVSLAMRAVGLSVDEGVLETIAAAIAAKSAKPVSSV